LCTEPAVKKGGAVIDEGMHMPDDQIYLELMTTVLHPDTQLGDVTTEELLSLLEKFLAADDNLDPSAFIVGWLHYAL
jgi:hypothetical protein